MVRRCRQLSTVGDDPEPDLTLKCCLAPGLPTVVELASVPIAPLGGDVAGRVGCAEGEPQQEGTARLVAPQTAEPGDRLLRQILAEVVALLGGAGRIDVTVVPDQFRAPMVGIAAQESVRVLEALTERPVPERPRSRSLVARGEVPLTNLERGIALGTKNLGEGPGLGWDPGRIAREVHRQVGQHAHPNAMVVATADQAGPRGRAHSAGVEVAEPNAPPRESVDGWSGDVGAVATELREVGVIDDDHDHVRRALTVLA